MKPGIYRMSFEKYLALDALSNSGLKPFLKSPAHSLIPFNGSAAAEFGTACHTDLLEPETFQDRYQFRAGTKPTLPAEIIDPVCMPEDIPTRRGKKWEAFKAENDGRTIMNQREWNWYHSEKNGIISLSLNDRDRLARIRAAVDEHETAKGIIESTGEREIVLIWLEHGVLCKLRADLWIPEYLMIIDLKTTRDASENFSGKRSNIIGIMTSRRLGICEGLRRLQVPIILFYGLLSRLMSRLKLRFIMHQMKRL